MPFPSPCPARADGRSTAAHRPLPATISTTSIALTTRGRPGTRIASLMSILQIVAGRRSTASMPDSHVLQS